jgi:sec-independent protein translocase protein TatC
MDWANCRHRSRLVLSSESCAVALNLDGPRIDCFAQRPTAMKYQPNDDLFKDSTMTFGEHLEELRACLFRALIGLVVGVAIGLAVGRPVVLMFQSPLVAALKDFYEARAEERVDQYLEDAGIAHEELPFDRAEAKRAVEMGLVPDRVYVSREFVARDEAAAATSQQDGQPGNQSALEEHLAKLGLAPMFIWRPSADSDLTRLKSFGIQESFMIYMKAAIVTGIVISSPWVFYQLWMFVAAGLYPHEKHYVHVFLPFSLGLFLAGACLAFFFVFKPVLSFLLSFNSWLGIDPDPRISEWFSFVLILPLGFGVSFQLPLVMLFLERIGIFTVEAYVEKWRIAIFAITVISAILTPADPYSMLLMAIPLTVLYFGGVLLCRYLPSTRTP